MKKSIVATQKHKNTELLVALKDFGSSDKPKLKKMFVKTGTLFGFCPQYYWHCEDVPIKCPK